MSFKVGIVGLPNVGKSTLFKALTRKQVDIANYPFCTIEPNVGTVAVPDFRLQKLNDFYNSAKIVPTIIEFVDIAGLVKGAHEGQGLGNKFLSHIREVDAICQVVRTFEDPNVIHVDGKIDPVSDLEVINLELIFADQETVKKRLTSLASELKGGKEKMLVKKNETLLKIKDSLEKGIMAAALGLDEEEKFLVKELSLLTLKPALYALNVAEADIKIGKKEILKKFNLSPHLPEYSVPTCQDCGGERIKYPFRGAERPTGRWGDMPLDSEKVILISAKIESELADLPPEEAKDYLKDLGLTESGLDKLIRASYHELDLITFFTAGPKDSHAWTIKKGALAPGAAGKIHTDFERGFIAAEIINWKDLLDAGGDAKAKEKGLIRLEGKEYVMQDGDVVEFRFSV